MSTVTISCPKCSAGLKLPDRKLLGRKGKCPRCQHRFILAEPDEVELTLLEADVPERPADPMVGTSAKWVPDSPPPPNDGPSDDGPSDSFLTPDSAAVAAPDPFDFSSVAQAAVPSEGVSASESHDVATGDTATVTGNAASRVRSRRKRKSRGGPLVIVLGSLLFTGSMVGIWWQQNSAAKSAAERTVENDKPQVNEAWQQEKLDVASANVSAKALSPTSGGVIPLDYFPFTPHLVFHLRPSEIWSTDRKNREFVATLGDLGQWLEQQIRDITRFEPQEIEELTFAVNFGPRTSPPEVAAVVRLRSEQTQSDLQLNRFRGTRRSDLQGQVFESDPFTYLLIDAKTFAVAPITMSDSLADARKYAAMAPVDIDVLLRESDRRRQMTLVFDLLNIDTHREYIFREQMQTFADEFVLWFGKDVQTVGWSLHLGSELFMETLLHPHNESSAMRAERHIKVQMEELPELLQTTARFMKPSTKGYREMIGRFPAMMQGTVLGTSTFVGPSYVRLITLLPDKAAANLAAASLFTWNQSVVTDFDGPAPVVAAAKRLPELIVDRLQMMIYVDFRNMPLQEALAYISEEIQTPIEIDGDGLKQAALTQNMKQSYNFGEVTVLKTLNAIITNPDYRDMMVMSIDEEAKKITVTSRPAATDSALSIFDTTQGK
ncbi:MAG: hypothetical protein GY903_25380 [Fuerstiella sp.]|nr:hypothetical protein [Fuerstiella sp.]MCP4857829.1 hypothetical protein [Fuerstiella sp.]